MEVIALLFGIGLWLGSGIEFVLEKTMEMMPLYILIGVVVGIVAYIKEH